MEEGRRELQLIKGRERAEEKRRESEKMLQEKGSVRNSREDRVKKDYQMCSNRRRGEGGRLLYVPREGGKVLLEGHDGGREGGRIAEGSRKEIAKEGRHLFVCLSVSCESNKWRRKR